MSMHHMGHKGERDTLRTGEARMEATQNRMRMAERQEEVRMSKEQVSEPFFCSKPVIT